MVDKITSDLYESLKCALKENIDDYDIELITGEQGQGFLGEIVFVNLFQNKTRTKKQLVAKQGRCGKESTVEILGALFRNEIRFYETIWPFLQSYYKNVSGKYLVIIPKCFGTGSKRILLENVASDGYKLFDKSKPFDTDHYRHIFETYGIYHGISMALREQFPEKYNQFVNGQINILKEVYQDNSKPFCKNLTGIFEEVQNFFDPVNEKHILEKVRHYQKVFSKTMYQFLTDEVQNGVILHGDCWSNNFMFKYDNQNRLQHVKLLDFQLVRQGSPVIDLSNCLYSGASEEILNNLDNFLKIYHDRLSKTLKEFGLSAEKLYSFRAFKEEWKIYCKFGFILAPFLWKLKLIDKDDVPDFTNDLNASIKISESKQDDFKKRFRELAFHMYNNNFF